MSAAQLASRLRGVAEEWPCGVLVWHRATGTRGVVVEYTVDGAGCVMLMVCFDPSAAWEKCLPCELSATRVRPDAEDGDGDEWKEGAA